MSREPGQVPSWWHEKFKGYGYRLTIPRQAVFGVLSKTSGHLSAEDVYLEVHKVYPDIGLTTVYRTLELLVQMRLALRFDFGDSRARYELSDGTSGHHHHLVCTNCKEIIDYTDFVEEEMELINRAEKGISQRFGFRIDNHIIQFYGLCSKCQSEEQTQDTRVET